MGLLSGQLVGIWDLLRCAVQGMGARPGGKQVPYPTIGPTEKNDSYDYCVGCVNKPYFAQIVRTKKSFKHLVVLRQQGTLLNLGLELSAFLTFFQVLKV